MTKPDPDASSGATGGLPAELPDNRRAQAVVALRDELSRAAAAALDRGYTAEAVDAYIDLRTDRLLSTFGGTARPAVENAANDPSASGME
jgi:hypothetical protein